MIFPHTRTQKSKNFLLCVLLLIPALLCAQDGFGFDDSGFGFSDSGSGFGGSARSSAFSLNIGGEVSAELSGFFDDFSSSVRARNSSLGDIFSGSLNFEAGIPAARGIINLDLNPLVDGSSLLEIDEAYVRAFFGPLAVEGGIRKVTWGKADSYGPLDIVNPQDFRDLTRLSDPQDIKIGRPMIRAILSLGSFSRLDAVFVPAFQGDKFATSGLWAPNQITGLAGNLVEELKTAMLWMDPGYINFFPGLDFWQKHFDIESHYSDSNPTLGYAQAGLRFTTSAGSSDLGFQYYFGRLPRPRVIIGLDNYFLGLISSAPKSNPEKITFDVDYNYYHQIGVDFARVIAGFNLRAEAGANITGDTDGNDGNIENPAFVWSLGFDRDLFAGINLNLQGSGSMKLFYSKIGSDPIADIEAGSGISSTRITGIVSRKFFREELELKTTGFWGIEDMDFLIMPAVIWTRNDVSAELSAGFFGGDKNGEMGQYRNNSFIRVKLSYRF